MPDTDQLLQKPVAEPRYRAEHRPEEITHVVCCRDHSWERALCGAGPLDHINLGAQIICTMCIEEFRAALAAMPQPVADDTCPVDGRPCPPDDEYLEIIRRRTGD